MYGGRRGRAVIIIQYQQFRHNLQRQQLFRDRIRRNVVQFQLRVVARRGQTVAWPLETEVWEGRMLMELLVIIIITRRLTGLGNHAKGVTVTRVDDEREEEGEEEAGGSHN